MDTADDLDIDELGINNLGKYLSSTHDQSQENTSVIGIRLSAFYLLELTNNILRICK